MHKNKIFLWVAVATMGLLLGCGGRDRDDMNPFLAGTSVLLSEEERGAWIHYKATTPCSQGRIMNDLSFKLVGGKNADQELQGNLERQSSREGTPSNGYLGHDVRNGDLIYVQEIQNGQGAEYNVILSLCTYDANLRDDSPPLIGENSTGQLESFVVSRGVLTNSFGGGLSQGAVENLRLDFRAKISDSRWVSQDRNFTKLPNM